MRYWRIWIWLAVFMGILATWIFRDALGSWRNVTLIGMLVITSILLIVALGSTNTGGRDIEKELSAVDKTMRRRDW
jgi:hypothetical protein